MSTVPTSQDSTSQSPANPSASLTQGGLPALVARAQGMLSATEGGEGTAARPFIIVAKSLPSAVYLREVLAPTRYLDEQGLPVTLRNAGRVAIYRAHSTAPVRRALLSDFAAGKRAGLIVTWDDLALPGSVEALSRLTSAGQAPVWLVQDAQALAFASPLFKVSGQAIWQTWQAGGMTQLELFAPVANAQVLRELAERFGAEEAGANAASTEAGAGVELHVVPEAQVLKDRALLTSLLKQQLALSGASRGAVVAPIQGRGQKGTGANLLPVEELLSVASEVGARALLDPGEDADAEMERQADVFHAASALIVTGDGEAFEALPPGEKALIFHLTAPASLEQVLDEAQKLATRGGGTWAYVGASTEGVDYAHQLALVGAVGRYVLGLKRDARGRVTLDAQTALASLQGQGEVSKSLSLKEFVRGLDSSLTLLWGAGLLTGVHRTHFLLEVAESHRFTSPHIDHDPRYGALRRRYDEALSKMGLMQAVRLQINARPAKDLRELSELLGYSVADLNLLFADLAREGLLLCRQVDSGTDQANANFELSLRLPTLEGASDPSMTGAASSDALNTALNSALESALEVALSQVEWRLSSLQQAHSALNQWLANGGSALSALKNAVEAGSEVTGSRPAGAPQGAGQVVSAPVSEVAATASTDAGGSGADRIVMLPLSREGADVDPVAGSATPTRPAASPGSAKGAATALAAFDDVLRGTAELSSASVMGWMSAMVGLQATPGRFQALAHALTGAPDSTARAVARILVPQANGDAWSAVDPLLELLGKLTDDQRSWLAPLLLRGLDYQLAAAEGMMLPSELSPLVLSLPLLELLEPTARATLLEKILGDLALTAEVNLEELGTVKLKYQGRVWLLRRQSIEPEQEARVWMALDGEAQSSLPQPLVRARLTEAWLMVDGLADASLTSALQGRVLEQSADGTWMDASRRLLALARAWRNVGKPEEALKLFSDLDVSRPENIELARLKAELEVLVGSAPQALQTLMRAGVQARGEGLALWQKVLAALESTCVAQATCEGCPLLGSAYCPSGSALLGLIEQNPFGEARKSLRMRVEKRVEHGLVPGSLSELNLLLEKLPGRWLQDRLSPWMESLPTPVGEAGLTLVTALKEAGAGNAARLVLERVLAAEGLATSLLSQAARLGLGLGGLGFGLNIALQADRAGWKAAEQQALIRELDNRFGRRWHPASPAAAATEISASESEGSELETENGGEAAGDSEASGVGAESASTPDSTGDSVGDASVETGTDSVSAAVASGADAEKSAQAPEAAGQTEPRVESASEAVVSAAVNLLGELEEEALGLLVRLHQLKRHQSSVARARERLQRLLRGNQWRELKTALDSLRGLLGEDAERETSIREAQARLTERERRIQHRFELCVKEGLHVPAARAEVERLAEDARVLGLTDLVARMVEQLAQAAQRQQEREAAAVARRAALQAEREARQAEAEKAAAEGATVESAGKGSTDGRTPRTDAQERSRGNERRDNPRGGRDGRDGAGRGRFDGPARSGERAPADGQAGEQQPGSGPTHEQGTREQNSRDPRNRDQGNRDQGNRERVSADRPGERGPRRGPDSRQDGRKEQRNEQRNEPRGERSSSRSDRGERFDTRQQGRGPASEAAPAVVLEGAALLDAIKSAPEDRVRVRLLMDGFRRSVAEDAEKGIKLMRDGLASFERVSSIDHALTRALKEGVLAKEHYPRLKRVLENVKGGGGLQAVFEYLAEQERPEQWKAVLGLLKLK